MLENNDSWMYFFTNIMCSLILAIGFVAGAGQIDIDVILKTNEAVAVERK
jgi:hypothetical protein